MDWFGILISQYKNCSNVIVLCVMVDMFLSGPLYRKYNKSPYTS